MRQSSKLRLLSAFRPKHGERSSSLYFSNEPRSEFDYYGDAFLDAARVLRRSIARRKGHGKADILPLLYLYRHSIELQAKALILVGNRLMFLAGQGLSEEEVFKSFERSKHRLIPLLPSIQQVFKYVRWEWFWPGTPVESFSDLRQVFGDLELIDRNSFTFRYPTDLRGQRFAGADVEFGLRSMVATLDSLAEALDTAVFGLEAEYSFAVTTP